MKKLALILTLITTPAAAFDPYPVGGNSFMTDTNPFESDASIAHKIAAFCRSKGFPDYAVGYRSTDIFAEQNFVCLREGSIAAPMYPNAGPAIIGVIPF
jgi:hypothetical protein